MKILTHNYNGIKIYPNLKMINWDNLRLVKEMLNQVVFVLYYQ